MSYFISNVHCNYKILRKLFLTDFWIMINVIKTCRIWYDTAISKLTQFLTSWERKSKLFFFTKMSHNKMVKWTSIYLSKEGHKTRERNDIFWWESFIKKIVIYSCLYKELDKSKERKTKYQKYPWARNNCVCILPWRKCSFSVDNHHLVFIFIK